MRLLVERLLEVNRTLRMLQLDLELLESLAVHVQLLLDLAQLLHLDEDAFACRVAAAQFRRRVVDVALVRHAAHADSRVVGAALRDRLVRRDEDVAEDRLHRSSRSLVKLDEVERELGAVLASSRDARLVGNVDLQRIDGQEVCPGLDGPRLDERRDRRIVPDSNVVQRAAGGVLERSRGSSVRLGQLDEAGNRAVDGGPVEAGVRVVGAEVGADDLAALELSSL